jgi:hypothetical protein
MKTIKYAAPWLAAAAIGAAIALAPTASAATYPAPAATATSQTPPPPSPIPTRPRRTAPTPRARPSSVTTHGSAMMWTYPSDSPRRTPGRVNGRRTHLPIADWGLGC